MNKSISYSIIAVCFVSVFLFVSTVQAKVECETKVRGAAFIPTSHLFREIYGTAAGNFDAEFAVKVYSHLQVWVNIDYTAQHGHSLGFRSPTSINIVNGSFGLKSPYDINGSLTVYAGIGPTFGRIQIKDKSQISGCSTCSKTAVGFVVKSGLDFFFTKCTFIDVFVDYVYQNAQFQRHVSASGVRIGVGLGVTF